MARTLKIEPLRMKSMLAFHRSQDWLVLWEEFYLSIDSSGRYLYKSSAQFAIDKGENHLQKEFLRWYLGPPPGDPELSKKYTFVTPLDWDKKRETGGWYTDENIKAGVREVRSKMDALAALKEVGGYPLRFLQRVEQLAQNLDKRFMGGAFVPGRTEGENIARTKAYLGLLDDLLKMEGHAFHLYAKSLGIDFSNLDGFASLVAATAQTQQLTSESQSKFAKAMEQIVTMASIKAGKYGTKLPDEVTNKMIEASAVPDSKKYKQ